jgi:hypothetical protein
MSHLSQGKWIYQFPELCFGHNTYLVMCDSGKLVFNSVIMEENKNVARLQELINNFKSKFPPAEDEASSNHLLSSKDIQKIISQHDTLCDIESTDFVELMKNSGYKSEPIEEDGEIGFKWLISSL